MLLIANKIKKTYGDKVLLNSISLSINESDKIGIIGVNGCGKSTLLKILAMQTESEYGDVTLIGDKKISYLAQEPSLNPQMEILEYVLHNVSKIDLEVLEFEAKSILTKLEIKDFTRKIKELSGGEKRKVALACSLVTKSDILILDEPTNHLDSDIIEWLEKYLMKYTKAIVLVTHDRYFLERITNKIIEIDHGNIYEYTANYSKYLELKSQREEYLLAGERKIQGYLKKEYEWIKRGPQARGTKEKKRIERYNEAINREKISSSELVISSVTTRLGNKTIELYDVGVEYKDVLFKNFSLNLEKDARIGIIGKNGTGKTSLLNVIALKTPPTYGTIEVGSTVKIGYFSQEYDFNRLINGDQKVIDYIREFGEYVKTKDGTISATSMLENFLFDDPYIYISKLSGGEKRRLYLLSVLIQSPNVLLLDEPTNDLDTKTLSILESYLEDFNGSVIIVSHDRYFLDRTVNKLYVLEDKRFSLYMGGYSTYLQERVKPATTSQVKNIREKEKTIKLSFSEEKEFKDIENQMKIIEEEIERIDKEINNNLTDYQKLNELYKEKEEQESKLEERFNRWDYLNNIYEQSKKK